MTLSPVARALFSALIAMVVTLSHSQAAVILYTDRASWQAAAGGGTGDIVDTLDSGTLARSGYTVGGTAQNAFPNGNLTTDIDGTGYIRVLLGHQGNPSFTTFTFDNDITAIGYDVNAHHSLGANATVTVSVDGLSSSYVLPDDIGDVNGFVGFVSDTAFTTYTVSSPVGNNAWHGIDNLEAFSSGGGASVPTPAPLLLLSSLGGLLAIRRRRAHTNKSNA